MSDKEYKSYADCIWCKSNNIIDILRDYIVKYEDPQTIEKYNLKKEDLLWSIRFLVTNLADNKEYFQVLVIAVKEWIPEITEIILNSPMELTKNHKEEILNEAKNWAKKQWPKQQDCEKILKMIEEHLQK